MATKKANQYASMTLDDLVMLNQEMARDQDEIRDERMKIRREIDARLPSPPVAGDGRVAYAQGDIGGQDQGKRAKRAKRAH